METQWKFKAHISAGRRSVRMETKTYKGFEMYREQGGQTKDIYYIKGDKKNYESEEELIKVIDSKTVNPPTMDNKTPIQEAIEYYQYEKTRIGKDRTLGKNSKQDAIEETESVISYLESLLPKEKEFASRVWDTADNRAEEERNYPYGKRGDNWKYPAKHEFLNQLYPEK